ncbi:MAG: hypothetical protein ACN4G0_02840 [Polyangiales bacterium]
MDGAPEIGAQPAGVGIRFDASMWPLVLVTMPPQLNLEDIGYLQDSYEAVFAAPKRHALIVDTSTLVNVPGATLRKRMKDFEDGRRPVIRTKNIGSAIVLSSSIARGAYTALRWISPQPAPNKAFGDLREAARWCIQGIEDDGQVAPATAYILAGMSTPPSFMR